MSLATGFATYASATQILAVNALINTAFTIQEAVRHLNCAETQLAELGLTWTEPTLQAVWSAMQDGIGSLCNDFEALIADMSAGTWEPPS